MLSLSVRNPDVCHQTKIVGKHVSSIFTLIITVFVFFLWTVKLNLNNNKKAIKRIGV